MTTWPGWPTRGRRDRQADLLEPVLSADAVAVLSGYVQSLAADGNLDLLPVEQAQLVDLAAFTRAADVLAACPPFRIEVTGNGNVGVLVAGKYVHTWQRCELEATAREVRAGWRGRYDGDY